MFLLLLKMSTNSFIIIYKLLPWKSLTHLSISELMQASFEPSIKTNGPRDDAPWPPLKNLTQHNHSQWDLFILRGSSRAAIAGLRGNPQRASKYLKKIRIYVIL